MNGLMDPAVVPDVAADERVRPAEPIECAGICHKGPIDGSAKALRYAAQHDPDAPAAFLMICPVCDNQLPLCEKKVDSLLEWAMLGSGFVRCLGCGKVPMDSMTLLPINQP